MVSLALIKTKQIKQMFNKKYQINGKTE